MKIRARLEPTFAMRSDDASIDPSSSRRSMRAKEIARAARRLRRGRARGETIRAFAARRRRRASHRAASTPSMGCASSSAPRVDAPRAADDVETADATLGGANAIDSWRLPTTPYAVGDDADALCTRDALARRRDEFWDTASAYGGSSEVWGALRACCEGRFDEETSREVLRASGAVSCDARLAVTFDALGRRYALPAFVRGTPDRFEEDG